MSDQQNFGFGKFVPGFDFLQNLAKGSPQTQAGVPNLANWVAPTLNVEELDKRIGELKAVSFWLDQNAKALAATIQALELQKMTLATLKGMNFNMAEVAEALKLKPAAAPAAKPAAQPTASAPRATAKTEKAAPPAKDGKAAGGAGVVDPLQWWGALTQQFQEIAAGAMKEAASNPTVAAVTAAAKNATQGASAGKTGAAKKSSRKASPKQ